MLSPLAFRFMRPGTRFLSSSANSPVLQTLVPTKELMAATKDALEKLRPDLNPTRIEEDLDLWSPFIVRSPEKEKQKEGKTPLTLQSYSALYSNEYIREALNLETHPLHGSPHDTLLRFGMNQSSHLSRDKMGQRGNSSYRIHASRGIGKSTVLTSLVPLLHYIYPNVIPVYLNMQECAEKPHFLNQRDIMEEVARLLDEHKLLGEGHLAGNGSRGELTYNLKKAGKFIFLIIDELDMMYRLRESGVTQAAYGNATYTLGSLAGLGDEASRRYFTLLCGSSSSLPHLIKADMDRYNDKKYPLHPFDLNCSKYKTYPVYSDPPTSLNAVRSLVDGKGYKSSLSTEELEGFITEATFMTGGNARLLASYLRDSEAYTRSGEGTSQETKLDEDSKTLRNALYDKLVEKNRDLLGSFIDNTIADGANITIEKVRTADLKSFKPLNDEDFRAIKKGLPTEDLKKKGEIIRDHLFDEGHITVIEVGGRAGHHIYPTTLLALALYAREYHSVHWHSVALSKVKDYLPVILGVGGKIAVKQVEKMVTTFLGPMVRSRVFTA